MKPRWIGSGKHDGSNFIVIECKTCSGTFGIQEGFNGYNHPNVEASYCPGCGQSIIYGGGN